MVAYVVFFLTACVHLIIWREALSSEIKLEECRPPDYPQSGGYGPSKDSYVPGDVIHYYCDTETYIGGNYRRVCVDNGEWSGDTPVCDAPAIILSAEQSSTAEPERKNSARRASDGDRTTCSSTLGEETGASWTGIFRDAAREVIRVMLFLPKGAVAYEVFMVKPDGTEISCGSNRKTIEIHDWVIHNCPQPHNTGGVSVKVKSLTKHPLEICELVVHTLTDPTCVDPHFEIDNGRLILSRKSAILSCNQGYSKWDGSPRKLDCIRTGVWTRRSLVCEEIPYETEEVAVSSEREGRPPPGERVISSEALRKRNLNESGIRKREKSP